MKLKEVVSCIFPNGEYTGRIVQALCFGGGVPCWQLSNAKWYFLFKSGDFGMIWKPRESLCGYCFAYKDIKSKYGHCHYRMSGKCPVNLLHSDFCRKIKSISPKLALSFLARAAMIERFRERGGSEGEEVKLIERLKSTKKFKEIVEEINKTKSND